MQALGTEYCGHEENQGRRMARGFDNVNPLMYYGPQRIFWAIRLVDVGFWNIRGGITKETWPDLCLDNTLASGKLKLNLGAYFVEGNVS